ncbi:hypothetical protein [Streptomyces sp. NPDC059850]|uniref:hypothetical protein n=1 Tax=Streptomyces sp. NPDC059850 TaxID=3346970 RepID=UPI003662BF15
MSVRGVAVAGAMVLAVVGITGCGKGDGAKESGTGKVSDKRTAGSAGSKAKQPKQPAQAANGVAQLTPKEILTKAEDALEKAPSWHLVSEGGTNKIDFSVDAQDNCRGSRSDEGEQMEFIQQRDTIYAKPQAGFYQGHFEDKAAQAQQFVGDRYVKTTSGDIEFAAIFCVRNMLSASLLSEDAIEASNMNNSGETDINGVRALRLTGTLAGAPTTVYVATAGDPYPVLIESEEEGQKVRMSFSDFGKPLPTDTPPIENTVDARELRKAIGISS